MGSELVTERTKKETHEDGLISRSSQISESKGAMENQMKKAKKKPEHEKWNARM
jgi:hypothetical protein